jgi:hypothetical protein
VRKSKLAERIFLVEFDSQYLLASTFLRIQEHYESRKFRNRVFSLEEYMDWYAATFGRFSYFEDWSGFNVPSEAFEAFFNGTFNPLSKKEERLLALFRRERRPFYVIGLWSKEDLTHELAHALFATRPEYRKEVVSAMREYDTSVLRKRLAGMGYHRHVLQDEVQAYLVAPEDAPGGMPHSLKNLRKRLRAIYRAHAKALHLPS